MTDTKTARMGRPKKDQPTDNYRMPRDLARKLRQLAVDAGMDAADYFAAEFGPAVEARHLKMVERMAREGREKKGQGG